MNFRDIKITSSFYSQYRWDWFIVRVFSNGDTQVMCEKRKKNGGFILRKKEKLNINCKEFFEKYLVKERKKTIGTSCDFEIIADNHNYFKKNINSIFFEFTKKNS